jgi:Tfp pilus assembly protein FimT
MSDTTSKRSLIIYLVAGAVLVVLGTVALVSFHETRETNRAQERAAQLSAELTAAGLRVPTTDQIVRVLGDDGGAVCANPQNALRRGVLYGMLTNGAGGPGQRPVLADNKVVQGQLMIMKVYCPQYVERFQEVIDDLKLTDTAG